MQNFDPEILELRKKREMFESKNKIGFKRFKRVRERDTCTAKNERGPKKCIYTRTSQETISTHTHTHTHFLSLSLSLFLHACTRTLSLWHACTHHTHTLSPFLEKIVLTSRALGFLCIKRQSEKKRTFRKIFLFTEKNCWIRSIFGQIKSYYVNQISRINGDYNFQSLKIWTLKIWSQ